MKKLTVLLIGLLMAVTLSAQEYRIHNTGNATFSIMFASPGGGFDVDDQVYGYFTYEGVNYVVGKAHRPPINTNAILTTMMQEGLMPDGSSVSEGVIDGAPAGSIIKIAAIRGGIAYEVNAGTIHIHPMNTLRNDVQSLPLTLYHLKNVSIDITKTVELQEVPYFAWLNAKCPEFSYDNFEIQHQAHGIEKRQGKNAKGDYEITIRTTNREVNVTLFRPAFAETTVFTVDGYGQYSAYKYYMTEADWKRGFVIIRATAIRYSGCLMESNPYREVRINIDTLPEPPRGMTYITPPAIVVPTVPFIAPPVVTSPIYEDDFALIAFRDTQIATGNKTDKRMLFYFQDANGITKRVVGVNPGEVRYTPNSNYHFIRYIVSNYKLDNTVNIQ